VTRAVGITFVTLTIIWYSQIAEEISLSHYNRYGNEVCFSGKYSDNELSVFARVQ